MNMHFRIANLALKGKKKFIYLEYSLLAKNGPMGINSFASILLVDHAWEPNYSKVVRETQDGKKEATG